MLYDGVRRTASGSIYRLGVALMDQEHPDVCRARGNAWVFGPETTYEREGDVANVCFPCGTTVAADRDTLRVYYGAADTCVALATGSIRNPRVAPRARIMSRGPRRASAARRG